MNTVQMSKESVKELFDCEAAMTVEKPNQANILILLYKRAYPDFDQKDKVPWDKVPWPKVNNKTWKQICDWFIDFDSKFHPDVMAGGLWLDSGFSVDDSLPDWEVGLT